MDEQNQPQDETLEGPMVEETQAEEKVVVEEVVDFKDKYIRLMADMENLRKRTTRDMEDSRRFAVSAFAREMLDVADNLERALDAIDKEEANKNEHLKNLLDGVNMVGNQLERIFGQFKIEKTMPKEGEKFNADFHQAMFEVPTNDYPAGTIAKVMQPGYMIAGRLLRPALVGTAKKIEEQPVDAPDNATTEQQKQA